MDKLIATKGQTKVWLRGGVPDVSRVGIDGRFEHGNYEFIVRAYNRSSITMDTLLADLQSEGFTIYPPVQADLLITAPVVRNGNS